MGNMYILFHSSGLLVNQIFVSTRILDYFLDAPSVTQGPMFDVKDGRVG